MDANTSTKQENTAKQLTGRPKAIIDWDDVGKMLEDGVNAKQIALILGIDSDTLYNRCLIDNKTTFSAFSQQNRSKGDKRLLSKQLEVALEGNPAMLIWLGKNRLGQTDKSEVTTIAETRSEVLRDFARAISQITSAEVPEVEAFLVSLIENAGYDKQVKEFADIKAKLLGDGKAID